MKVITEFPKLWTTTYGVTDFPSPSSLQFVAGRPWWIGVGSACGLVVSVTKIVLRLDAVPSFIDEIKAQHVRKWAKC